MSAGVKDPCTDCVDYVRCGARMICDYIGHNGHSRPCPPGEDCTVKSLTPRAAGKRGPKFGWDTGAALRLYRQGRSDREIAQAVGTAKQNIFGWRRRKGLKANVARRKGDCYE